MGYGKIDGLWAIYYGLMVKKKKKKASAIVYFINPFVGLRLASPTENLDSRISVT